MGRAASLAGLRITQLCLIVLALADFTAARQIAVEWRQPGVGNWSDAMNWQQIGTDPPVNVVPNGPDFSATIATLNSATVNLDLPVSLDSLTLTAPNTIRGGQTITTRAFDHTGLLDAGVRVNVTE